MYRKTLRMNAACSSVIMLKNELNSEMIIKIC